MSSLDIPLYGITDGYQFQQLVAEYFRSLKGERAQYHIADIDVDCNGVGPDRGIDVIVTFYYLDPIHKHKQRWLIECKCWNENRSLGIRDLDTNNIVSLLKAKEADGYLLVCKGNVTNNLKERFRELSSANGANAVFEVWEGMMFWHKIIEREILLKGFFFDWYNEKYIQSKLKEEYAAKVAEFQEQLNKTIGK